MHAHHGQFGKNGGLSNEGYLSLNDGATLTFNNRADAQRGTQIADQLAKSKVGLAAPPSAADMRYLAAHQTGLTQSGDLQKRLPSIWGNFGNSTDKLASSLEGFLAPDPSVTASISNVRQGPSGKLIGDIELNHRGRARCDRERTV